MLIGGDRSATGDATRVTRPTDRAALGAAVVLGWVLCDLVIFLAGGEPARVFGQLLAPSAVAVAAGALGGLLLGGRRLVQLVVAALLFALGQWAAASASHPHAHAGLLLDSVGVMVLALALAELASGLVGGRPTGAAARGLVLGALGCTVSTRVHSGTWVLPVELLVPLGLFLGLDLWSRGSWTGRARTTALVLALALVVVLTGRRSVAAAEVGPPGLATLPAALPSGAPRPPDMILLVMDTVRADHLSCYGYERETSPGLDAFAREEATRYTRARSTSPFTLASHASLLTGLFPASHGAIVGAGSTRGIREGVPRLGERLAAAGYRTGAVVANRLYLNRQLGFDRGFHHFDDRRGTMVKPHVALAQMAWMLRIGDLPRLGHTYRDAPRIIEAALDWIDEGGDEPFFLLLNFLDAHWPFKPPAEFYDVFRDPERKLTEYSFEERRELLYDSEILFLDHWLTRFREELRARGLYEDLLLVITSDHGHAFGDHGHKDHCWFLYEEQVHVPLLVKFPRRSASGGDGRVVAGPAVDERPITGVEVHDLFLRVAGVDVPPREPHPEGLTAEWYPWPLTDFNLRMQEELGRDLSRYSLAWVRGNRKVIVYSDGEVEAYDLERDPLELHPLELSRAELEAARAEAAAWWEQHPFDPEAAGDLDEEQVRELLELGYG